MILASNIKGSNFRGFIYLTGLQKMLGLLNCPGLQAGENDANQQSVL